MIRSSLKKRVDAAIHVDNTVVIPRTELGKASGFTQDYFQFLGLSKSDLKKLERAGVAVRGYVKVKRPGKIYLTGTQTEVRWVLYAI